MPLKSGHSIAMINGIFAFRTSAGISSGPADSLIVWSCVIALRIFPLVCGLQTIGKLSAGKISGVSCGTSLFSKCSFQFSFDPHYLLMIEYTSLVNLLPLFAA